MMQHRDSIHRASAGFTLIELMVTIAIVAILTTLALPAMRDYFLNQSIKTASFDLMSTLLYARSEAIKRANDVNVTATGSWQGGWTVQQAGDTTTLRSQPALNSANITISATPSSSTTVTYGKDGRLSAGAAVVFTIKSPSSTSISPRCISVSSLSSAPVSTVSTTGTCP